MSTHTDKTAALGIPIVYYNGACPVCRAEINHYRDRAERYGVDLEWCDISQNKQALSDYGVDADRVFRRLHAVESGGHLRAGVDAFVVVWQRLPGYGWLARLMQIGWLKGIARFAYDRIAAPALYQYSKARGVV